MTLSIFSYAFGNVFIFEKYLVKFFAHLKNQVVYFVVVVLEYLFIYYGCQIYGLQIFPPICRLPFHPVDCFLCCAEVFQFDVLPFVYFLVLPPMLLLSYSRNNCPIQYHEIFLCVFF